MARSLVEFKYCVEVMVEMLARAAERGNPTVANRPPAFNG
jgi:hypothetical protein